MRLQKLLAIAGLGILSHGLFAQSVRIYRDAAAFESAAASFYRIDFDDIAPNTDISGQTIQGVTFQRTGAPLIVVRAEDTYTPTEGWAPGSVLNPNQNKLIATSGENVLSPGGIVLGPGPNPDIEDDSLTLIFQRPVPGFGFDHISQSADGASFTSVFVYAADGSLIFSETIPISDTNPGSPQDARPAADFWGILSDTPIARIVFVESDSNNVHPDCNIGYDSFRVVPEPASLFGLGVGLAGLVGLKRRKR